MYFRNLVLSAFFIAIISGVLYSLYQAFFITPIIIGSELYEMIEPNMHRALPWSPEDGIERHSWSFAANFLVCFAYAIILLSVMSMTNTMNTLQGLFWGGAAFFSIFAAPALGLPPEIPGMEAAQLENRQIWWIFTVTITAFSFWLISYRGYVLKIVGMVLLAMPHLLGAPAPKNHGFMHTDPEARLALVQLWYDFIIQTSISNALLWVVIGGLSGYLVKNYIYPLDKIAKQDG